MLKREDVFGFVAGDFHSDATINASFDEIASRTAAKVVGRQTFIRPSLGVELPKAEFAAGCVPDISEVFKVENTISRLWERLAKIAVSDRNFFQWTCERYRQRLIGLYDLAGKCDFTAISIDHRPCNILRGS
jgi:hypothetical protein